MTLDVAAQVAVITYPVLIVVLGIVLRQIYVDMKEKIGAVSVSVGTESLSRSAAITAMRSEFVALMAGDRRELEKLTSEFDALRREIDKDYLNYDKLEHMLQPLKETQERMRIGIEHIAEKVDKLRDRRAD